MAVRLNKKKRMISATGIVGLDGEDGILADAIDEALDEAGGDDLTLRLRSNGGEVFEGFAIYNRLQEYSGRVDVVVDAMAGSIATVIMLGGAGVKITANGRVFVHNSATIAAGNAREFREMADFLAGIDSQVADLYAEKAGNTSEDWAALMDAETYLSAERAVEIGIVDGIVGAKAEITASEVAMKNRGIVTQIRLAKIRASREN